MTAAGHRAAVQCGGASDTLGEPDPCGLHETTACDAAYGVLVFLTLISMLLPIFVLAWAYLVSKSYFRAKSLKRQ